MRVSLIIGIFFLLGCNNAADKRSKESNSKKSEHIKAETLSRIDYNIIFDNKIVDSLPVSVLDIGDLNVTTGKIVVCDPLVYPDMPPYSKTVKPGKYPVKIYIAKTKKAGGRYAIAKLEFSNKRADKWVLAIHDGENDSDLKKDEYLGFPVDAGLASFFDQKAGVEYKRFIDEFENKNPEGNIYDDFFASEFKKNAKRTDDPNDDGDWINFKIPNTNHNVVMFHSGYGDGTYPVYWGMTKNNEIVSLVIDFFVLLSPDE